MRKRFNVFWRVAVVMLLVVMAIASIVTASDTIQAAGPRTQTPNTYMDPIPERINGAFADSEAAAWWISGTTLDGATGPGYNVTKVQVMIGRNIDGWCWNSSSQTWNATSELWNSVVVAQDWTPDQWLWSYNASFIPAAGHFTSGWIYTVWARAVDDDGYWDPTPASDAFIYDNESPDISSTTNFLSCMTDLTEIKGTADDDCGDLPGIIQQVRLMIVDLNHSVCWNGYFWQPTPIFIKAQGTSSWTISTTTKPPLPKWQNNTSYVVLAIAEDNAGNVDFIGPYTFNYHKKLSSASCFLDPLPAWANGNATTWPFMNTTAGGITGTSLAIPTQHIDNVSVEIKDTTNNVYWNLSVGGWHGSVIWADCLNTSTYPPVLDAICLTGQYDWNVSMTGVTFLQGHTYQIRAKAGDNSATNKTYISGTESFIYDNLLPGNSNINPFDNIVYNAWNSLTGNCQDDTVAPGKIAAEVVLIQRSIDNLFWNGVSWGPFPWGTTPAWDWLYAAGSFPQNKVDPWRVDRTTEYPLPPMTHNMSYNISALSFDCAGNQETTATKNFTFKMNLHNYTWPSATAVPTNTSNASTGTPHATSTTVPTSPPGGTKTPTATIPPVATKTPTTVPAGFSGSGTIGAAGGTVVAEDGSGDTRVIASFDAGAFGSNTPVTISGSGNCNAVGAAPSGYSKGNSCFDIEPEGDLDANVEVCVYYTAADENAGGGDPDNLVLAYKDGGTWVILDTTVDGDTICAETDHIGTFAVLGKAAAGEGEWEWWYYLLIGLGALLIVAIIVLILIRPKGAGEGAAEEGYEEEEEI